MASPASAELTDAVYRDSPDTLFLLLSLPNSRASSGSQPKYKLRTTLFLFEPGATKYDGS